MKNLWTFTNKEKCNQYIAVIQGHGIDYVLIQKGESGSEITIAIEEKYYEKAKKLLLKFRTRRTGSDLV